MNVPPLKQAEVASNSINIASNTVNISDNAAAISTNDADILSISNDVASNTHQIQQLGDGNCNFIFKQALPNICIGI